MARSDVHLDAMLRHLGAAYYEATQGRASRADVTRALETVAEAMHEKVSYTTTERPAPAAHPAHRGHPRPHSRRWARRVEDVMTTAVVTVDRITPYKEIARLLTEHKISSVPVLSMGRHVVGLVSEADLVAAEDEAAQRARVGDERRARWLAFSRRGQEHSAMSAGDLMTAPAITIHPDAPVPSAARVMHTRQIRMLPVVDPEGKLIGVVSRRDLLSVFLRPDEEIAEDVRQVLDEVFGAVGMDLTVTVGVRNGVVTLTGVPEPKAGTHDDLFPVANRLIWGVDGVVDVVNKPGASAA